MNTRWNQKSRSKLRLLVVVCLSPVLAGCNSDERNRATALTQATRWADKLDRQTTETGVYVRHQGEQLPERDPWGVPLKVVYEQGGAAEMIIVSSAGPDREFDTTDDIIQQRMSANLKGIGEGIKKNAGTVAEEAARGAARGMITGLKEGVRDTFSGDKDGEGAEPPQSAEKAE